MIRLHVPSITKITKKTRVILVIYLIFSWRWFVASQPLVLETPSLYIHALSLYTAILQPYSLTAYSPSQFFFYFLFQPLLLGRRPFFFFFNLQLLNQYCPLFYELFLFSPLCLPNSHIADRILPRFDLPTSPLTSAWIDTILLCPPCPTFICLHSAAGYLRHQANKRTAG